MYLSTVRTVPSTLHVSRNSKFDRSEAMDDDLIILRFGLDS